MTDETATSTSFRHLIEASRDGVIVTCDDVIVYANGSFARTLGYESAASIIGTPCSDLAHPDDRAIVRGRTAVLAPGESRDAIELRMRGADRQIRIIDVSCAYVADFDGAPATVLVARDVTTRRREQDHVLLSERMASVGALGAAVAHEINNPLAATFANVAWMSGQLVDLRVAATESKEKLHTFVEDRIDDLDDAMRDAIEGADRVRNIVKDLRIFSHGEGAAGPVDLVRVLDSTARMARNEVARRARLTKDYTAALPPAFGSEPRLAQVFLNLLVNAAQAIPEGQPGANEIIMRARADEDHVFVDIVDTGSGMSPEVARRIFEPFFTTKPIGVGTGLGLAICHRILSAIGATIDVTSEIGRGSTFRVTLRRAAGTPVRPRTAPAPPAPRRGRILVVDDDAMIASVMKRLLGRDHDVTTCTNGREAFALFERGETFDVVFCDLMMPEMSGMDLHDALARTRPTVAADLIFITGGAFTPAGRAFLDRVPNTRCDKPFEAERIRTLVAERLRES